MPLVVQADEDFEKKSIMPRNRGKLKRSMGFCTFLCIFVSVFHVARSAT